MLAANPTSTNTTIARDISRTAKVLAGQGDNATGRTQISATSPVRPVRIIGAALLRKREVPPPHRCALHRRRRKSLAGHRNRRQNSVQYTVGCGPLEFGFGPKHHPV